MKIVSTFSRQSFELANVALHQNEEVTFAPFLSEEFFSALAEADCLFTSSLFDLNKEVIGAGKHLKLIQTMGVGFNLIDLDYAAQQSIYVCNNKACNSIAVAEHAVGLMLAGLKRMPHYERRAFSGEFAASMKESFVVGLHQLSHRRVGLIGFGDIAKAVAKMLGAFGCEIYYYNRTRADCETERAYGVTYLTLAELIRTCNVISLHVPAAPNTIDLISHEEFAMMGPDTLLINTARGEVINIEALVKALTEGRIFGAAMDTTAPEPPPADHPLLNLPPEARERLILTPHIAGATVEALTNSIQGLMGNARCIAEGRTPRNVVNGMK